MSEQPSFSPDIIEIQPCTEEGLVTLEAKLGGKEEHEILDPVVLCRCLNASPVFDHPRCSAEMGYGMLEKDGRKIHAFKTGKVIIRRAEGRDQALGHLRLVSRTIWPAMRIGGGDALVTCIASEKGCASFPAPPADGGELPAGRTFAQALLEARKNPLWDKIDDGLARLRAIASAYPQSGVSKATKEQFRKAEGPFLAFMAENGSANEAAIAIPMLSASYNLDAAMQASERLPAEARPAFWALAAECFEAAVAGATEKAANLTEKIEAERAKMGVDIVSVVSLLRLPSARIP